MPKKRLYAEENLAQAVSAVLNKSCSIRQAANKYNVPRSSIHYKIKHPESKFQFGPCPILTFDEELTLENWVIDLAGRGFPRKKEDLKSCVQKFLEQNPRPNPFTNNRPGDGWMKSFLKRHPKIVERSSEGVTNASAIVSEDDIRKWFCEINKYIESENLTEVVKDPRRIFNADESGFNICPKSGKVLTQKGCKNAYEIEKGSSKENISVMFTFAANGFWCKPMIVYAYQRLPEKLVESVPSGWGIAKSEKGWMTAPVFYEYIANVFYKQILEENVPFPVILFVDGHKSHISIEVTELCKSLQIHLIALYPNATRILQPADVSAFRPIKAAWRHVLREWYAENQYITTLNKVSFAPVLEKALNLSIKPTTIINGFRVTGLYPLNPDAVDYSKCLTQKKHNISFSEQHDSSLQVKPEIVISYDYFSNVVGKDIISKLWTMDTNIRESNELKALYSIFQLFLNTDMIQELNLPPQNKIDLNETIESLNENTGSNEDKSIENFESQACLTSNQTQDKSNHVTEEGKKITVLSNVSLEDFLKTRLWPQSPKRKGKRNIERMPFAMTSDDYINKLRDKRNLKENNEKLKEERKQKRDENKRKQIIGKENVKKKCKIGKERKKTTIYDDVPSTSTGIKHLPDIPPCCVCHKDTITSIIRCSDCCRYFHKKCVPTGHQLHIPEEEDDLYLCHMCYEENNDSFDEGIIEEDEISEIMDYMKNN